MLTTEQFADEIRTYKMNQTTVGADFIREKYHSNQYRDQLLEQYY